MANSRLTLGDVSDQAVDKTMNSRQFMSFVEEKKNKLEGWSTQSSNQIAQGYNQSTWSNNQSTQSFNTQHSRCGTGATNSWACNSTQGQSSSSVSSMGAKVQE